MGREPLIGSVRRNLGINRLDRVGCFPPREWRGIPLLQGLGRFTFGELHVVTGTAPISLRFLPRIVCFIAALAGAFVVIGSGALGAVPHVCIMRETLGAPCPGCGTLSAFRLLASGDLQGAHALQPAISILGAWLTLSLAAVAFGHRVLTASAGWLASVSGVALVAVWLLRLLHVS